MELEANDVQFVSDYEREWGLPSDTSDGSDVAHKQAEEKTSQVPAANTNEAHGATGGDPTNNGESNPAVDERAEILASMTEAQRAAFLKQERDAKAMMGRHRLAKERAEFLEKQLAETEREKQKVLEAQRQPTQFEQQHPEYFQELRQLFGTNEKQETPKVNAEAEFYTQADIILAAHPDAGEIYNTQEFQAWKERQPISVRRALDGNDGYAISEALDSFKASTNNPQDRLRAISERGSSSSRPAITGGNSFQSQYDAEWAKED